MTAIKTFQIKKNIVYKYNSAVSGAAMFEFSSFAVG